MNSQPVSDEALRKRKRRAMETADERESRLSKDRERKRKKVEEETEEQRLKRLEYQRKKIMQRRTTINDNHNKSRMHLRPRIVNPQQKDKEPQQKDKEPQQRSNRSSYRLERNDEPQQRSNRSSYRLERNDEPQQRSNRSEEPQYRLNIGGETLQDPNGNIQQTLERSSAAELSSVDRKLLKNFLI
ncbi:unnamed protein product [Rhizophagus irregularis]|uniref:Uncharacterized protein n=1 Tax=Rhizophagus irregularis TaxID=588596 RepID=A0A915ZWI6_9GLOM|nr:unnamed protein product [Rhizophagus irregularis]